MSKIFKAAVVALGMALLCAQAPAAHAINKNRRSKTQRGVTRLLPSMVLAAVAAPFVVGATAAKAGLCCIVDAAPAAHATAKGAAHYSELVGHHTGLRPDVVYQRGSDGVYRMIYPRPSTIHAGEILYLYNDTSGATSKVAPREFP